MQEKAPTRTILNYFQRKTPKQGGGKIAKESSEALVGEKRSREDQPSSTAHLHVEVAKVLKTEDSQRSPS